MSEEYLNIHGMKVKVDAESDSAKYGAHYLSKLSSEEAKVFFDAAKRDLVNGVAHLETPHTNEHTNVVHNLTLIHNGDGTYQLRKRTGH